MAVTKRIGQLEPEVTTPPANSAFEVEDLDAITSHHIHRDNLRAWMRDGVLLADGSVAMAAALDMGGFAITNVGTVDGRDVSADGGKLDGIEAGAQVNAVDSVFGRTGAVVAEAGDYAASLVSNDSGVTGSTVKAALDALSGKAGTLQEAYDGGATISGTTTLDISVSQIDLSAPQAGVDAAGANHTWTGQQGGDGSVGNPGAAGGDVIISGGAGGLGSGENGDGSTGDVLLSGSVVSATGEVQLLGTGSELLVDKKNIRIDDLLQDDGDAGLAVITSVDQAAGESYKGLSVDVTELNLGDGGNLIEATRDGTLRFAVDRSGNITTVGTVDGVDMDSVILSDGSRAMAADLDMGGFALDLASDGNERIVANGDSIEAYTGGTLALSARELLDASGDVGLLASATVDHTGIGTAYYDGARVDVDASGTIGDGTSDPDGIGNTVHRWRVNTGSGLETVAAILADGAISFAAGSFEVDSAGVITAGGLMRQTTESTTTRAVSDADHNRWIDCDTDAAAGDITVTVNAGAPGAVVHFRKKGTGGNVVFAEGTGVTLSGDTTLFPQDSVAGLYYTSATTAIVFGEAQTDPASPADGDTNIAVRTHQGAGPTAALQDVTLSALDVDGQRALTVPGTKDGGSSVIHSDPLQTTDATGATLLSFTPEDGHVYWFQAHVAGARDSSDPGSGSAQAFLVGRITRDGATVTVTYTTLDSNFSSASYSVSVDSSSTTVRVRVFGDTGHTINWTGTMWYGHVNGPFASA